MLADLIVGQRRNNVLIMRELAATSSNTAKKNTSSSLSRPCLGMGGKLPGEQCILLSLRCHADE